MVYKKYIKKDGKFYGPYIYNSRRVNGKVISEYQGTGKKDYKRFILLSLGILLIVLLMFFIINSRGKISGNVIANNPISSQTENVMLNEAIYPTIYFTLVSTQKQISNPTQVNEIPQTSSNEVAPENSTIANSHNINNSVPVETPTANETNPSVNSSSITSSVIASTSLNATTTTQTETTSITNTSTATSPENSAVTQIPASTIPAETPASTPSEQSSTASPTSSQTTPVSTPSTPETATTPTPEITSTTTPETTPTNEGTSAPITGGIISRILKTVSNFFLGFLKPTGMVVSEQNVNSEIKGEVSADKLFNYSLKDGENIQLLSGSVKTNSKSLPDNTIQIVYQGNNVLISTNYSESIPSNATSEKINFNIEPLNDQEKEILNKEFGNVSIQTTKSELFNGRYIVGYQLGDYNIEYSYDPNLNNETLKSQVEIDKTKWLRDLVNKLSSTTSVAQDYSLPA